MERARTAAAEREQVVAVTGAAGGIGAALARHFARQGARLGLLDRDAGGLEKLAAELRASGHAAVAVPCDVTSPEACQKAIAAVVRELGGLDVLINNAGLTHLGLFEHTDADILRTLMDVNFFGAVHCTQAALQHLLRRRGWVVVISSVAGFAPLAGRCGYAASKHALHGLFDTLRAELRSRGVRVLIVCPGFTDTRIEQSALRSSDTSQFQRITTGQLMRPEQVAESIHRAMRRGRRQIVLTRVGKLSLWLSRLAPALYERIMTRRMLPNTPAPPEA